MGEAARCAIFVCEIAGKSRVRAAHVLPRLVVLTPNQCQARDFLLFTPPNGEFENEARYTCADRLWPAVRAEDPDAHHNPVVDIEAVGASTTAYRAVNARMHQDMDIALGGDADVDFVRSMIPHHQGAIDMAKVVLKHGQDLQVHKIAEELIHAQEGEFAFMCEWLAKRGQ